MSLSARIRFTNQGAVTKEYPRYFEERQRRVVGRGPASRLINFASDI